MERPDMEQMIRNIDERLARVEQFLPLVATKADLQAFPTRDDPKGFATTADLAAYATKEDLRAAVAPLATRDEVRAEGERTRRHFDVVAERMHDDVKLSLEGHRRLTERVDALERTTGSIDRRVRLLEAGAPRRKR